MSSSRKRLLEEGKASGENKKQKGPHGPRYGLHNQGSTCYLNSVLQVLFMTPEMHNSLDPKPKTTDGELRNLFRNLTETTGRTENITRCLEIKNVHQQRDAAECLEMILRKVSPKASEVFQGQLQYTTKCCRGHSINEETNPFWTLPLSMKDAHDTTYSVEENLERIFRTTSFTGDNMVFCDECERKTDATSGCEMVEAPQVLIILLKRFDFDYNTRSHFKSDRRVDVPIALRMKEKKYKLYGIVNHMGGLGGGHYTANILSSEDNTWYECDDTRVTKLRVEDQPGYRSSTAYLLVYRASGSLRNKVKEPQEHKRKSREHEGHDKENRQNRESSAQVRKERNKEALNHHSQGEVVDAKPERKVSSYRRSTAEEEFPISQKQITRYSTKQHPDTWTRTENTSERRKNEEGEACKGPSKILKNPFFIATVVVVCALVVILPIIITSLSPS
uniref:ubiquitin carboxyl-terminal hydrolase 47-like n=1 Tax=Scatophagus argus TaxID=75038 RepID=UPI001ED846E1|nr:ubiquitin carboxyl-terminal hydrolase 47-like [Scatophagus argus]